MKYNPVNIYVYLNKIPFLYHASSKTFSSLLFFALFISMPTFADSFTCNNNRVKTGDTTVEVKVKCGKPFDIESVGKVKINNKRVRVHRYTYIPEKGRFIKILEFHGGKLVSVSNGPRV